MRICKIGALSIVCSALLVVVLAGQSAMPVGAVEEVHGYSTMPSKDVTLSFPRPGRVAELMVKLGDKVKAGQVVARQDDAKEASNLAMAVIQANAEVSIVAQEKLRNLAAITLQKKVDAKVVGLELEEARVNLEINEARVDQAKIEHTLDGHKRDQAQAVLDETRVISPIDGIVEQTMIKVGESADQMSLKVMRIVNIDQLWIDVPVTFSVARQQKEGDSISVKLSNGEIRTAKIIHISTVADAATQTLQIRVEVENSAKTPAGEKVTVSFPKK